MNDISDWFKGNKSYAESHVDFYNYKNIKSNWSIKTEEFFSDENNTKNYLLLTQVPESKLLNYQTQLSISYDIHQTWLHPPQLVQSYRTRRILF